MKIIDLVKFDIQNKGVKIVALAKSCDVSVYIIRSILDGRTISNEHAEKVANHFGYKHSNELIRINQQVSK